ncbi:hypothetical protein ACFYXM_26160 [Streptomyces sp. NPDC002476]|uniref:hypothetical protein n=1 Tax=Streptomyces sp. NPDC002476 TaxID=3364648 RepID=UPI003698187D
MTADGRIETARMRGEPASGDAVLRILVELAAMDAPGFGGSCWCPPRSAWTGFTT